MELIQFEAKHLFELTEKAHMPHMRAHLDWSTAYDIEEEKYSRSFLHDGKIVGCGGLYEYGVNRAELWAIIDTDDPRLFYKVHALGKQFIKEAPYKRIEAVVDYDYIQGHRWVKALGFKQDSGVLKYYRDNGTSTILYSIVRD